MRVWMLKLLNVITAATAVSFVIELCASPILLSCTPLCSLGSELQLHNLKS